jgi:hypothetical protein
MIGVSEKVALFGVVLGKKSKGMTLKFLSEFQVGVVSIIEMFRSIVDAKGKRDILGGMILNDDGVV